MGLGGEARGHHTVRERGVGACGADPGQSEGEDQTDRFIGAGNRDTDDIAGGHALAREGAGHAVELLLELGVGDDGVVGPDDGRGIRHEHRQTPERRGDIHYGDVR